VAAGTLRRRARRVQRCAAYPRPSFCFPSGLMREGCQGGSHTTSTVTFGCPSAAILRFTSSGMVRADGQPSEVRVIFTAIADSSMSMP